MEHDAKFEAGRAQERAGNTGAARSLFAQAAQAGHLGALTALAKSLLVKEPFDIGNGIGMLRSAADRGDAEAAELCAVLAGQDDALPGRWQIAQDYLTKAAQGGAAHAVKQAALLGGDLARWAAAPSAKVAFEAPRILTIDNFAPPAICDWLIEAARPRLKAAEVYDPASGTGQRRDDIRSNSAVNFGITQFDMVMVTVRAKIAALAGVQSHDFEPPMVLHYAPGQHFAPHFDFIEPNQPGLAADIARNGQRVGTFLLYLNDGFEGGETDFPELGWAFKGKKGDGILFWSADAKGTLDRRTLHAGAAVTSGEKWILSQWIRRR